VKRDLTKRERVGNKKWLYEKKSTHLVQQLRRKEKAETYLSRKRKLPQNRGKIHQDGIDSESGGKNKKGNCGRKTRGYLLAMIDKGKAVRYAIVSTRRNQRSGHRLRAVHETGKTSAKQFSFPAKKQKVDSRRVIRSQPNSSI